jgi:plastocyanin
MKMKALKIWLGGLLGVGMVLFMIVPGGWAEEAEDEDIGFEFIIKDTSFKHEGVALKYDEVVVVPAGIVVGWLNVDPLITNSGLEGVMPHGLMIINPEGKVIKQSPLLFQGTRTFTYKFDSPGLYTFQCFVHPALMKGKFLVFDAQLARANAQQHAAR